MASSEKLWIKFSSKDENHNIADFLKVLGKDRHMIGSELPLISMAALNVVRWSRRSVVPS